MKAKSEIGRMDRMMTVCCKGNEVAGFIESLTSGSYEITVCGEIDDASFRKIRRALGNDKLEIRLHLNSAAITEIKVDAFENCSGLTQITLPDSVTEIGQGAFYDCTALKTAYIPKKLDVDRVFDDSTQVVRK